MTQSTVCNSLHRIVIVGGGAGGLELATRLGKSLGKSGKAKIILVDSTLTHIWKPFYTKLQRVRLTRLKMS
jgi:NADH dehydrogenase FAD-containing subunit